MSELVCCTSSTTGMITAAVITCHKAAHCFDILLQHKLTCALTAISTNTSYHGCMRMSCQAHLQAPQLPCWHEYGNPYSNHKVTNALSNALPSVTGTAATSCHVNVHPPCLPGQPHPDSYATCHVLQVATHFRFSSRLSQIGVSQDNVIA